MTTNATILVAEDDIPILEGLIDSLESEGYATLSATDGQTAIDLYRNENPDLILLDVMMPKMSGYDVCKEIRKTDPRTPVMMLTAKSEEIDKILGLEFGADDYVTKPFGVRELLARINALLRRLQVESPGTEPDQEPFSFGAANVIPKRFEIEKANDVKQISQRELTLLRYFRDHADEVLTRDQLLNAAWGISYYGTTRTLDQHIAQLRKKVEPDNKRPSVIVTVHGIGYRYDPKATN